MNKFTKDLIRFAAIALAVGMFLAFGSRIADFCWPPTPIKVEYSVKLEPVYNHSAHNLEDDEIGSVTKLEVK